MPTRDGHAKPPSINDHYAVCDFNYSVEEVMNCNGKVVARDDKALVHCDVEVVQRPSKSWAKVTYSDHDWDKDTQRTLQLTTLQFVKLKDVSYDEEAIAQLGGVQVCQSKLSGGAVSLVKIHFFESSTIFRHFNELLFVMSHPQHQQFFMHGNDLLTQMLISVDGGADERPRNKLTMFAAVLLRKLLDLDKLKLISHAKGSSKRHSVERVHFAEGRALSQGGVISSKGRHETELEDGLFSMEKFQENMEVARHEAIQRLDGIPYAGEQLNALVPPLKDDWVIEPTTVAKIINFLKKDTTQHRVESNFVIRPQGKVWKALCQVFDLSSHKAFSAMSVFNEHCDPHSSWQQHYGFTCYRPDDSWRGLPVNRYEIQPIIDVGQLPDYKYLPYSQAKLLVQYFVERNLELPVFLRAPDFYLPSKNIKFTMDHKSSALEEDESLVLFSQLLGVSKEDIVSYIHNKKEKADTTEKRATIKERFKDTLLGPLSKNELKSYLEKLKVSWTRLQDNKADLLVLLDKELKSKSISVENMIEM